jgi:hypothetical protein
VVKARRKMIRVVIVLDDNVDEDGARVIASAAEAIPGVMCAAWYGDDWDIGIKRLGEEGEPARRLRVVEPRDRGKKTPDRDKR